MGRHPSQQQRQRRSSAPLLLPLLALAAVCLAPGAAAVSGGSGSSRPGGPSKGPASAGSGFVSIAAIPGCGSSSSGSRALLPELHSCSWQVQVQRHSARWYAFEIPPDAADNMSVVIMARAVSGQITMALWGPGSDPARSVPTQVGTNYMEWPGLRETDQQPDAAGGGHASLASEQQYLFLARRDDRPLLVGQYVVVVHADMGQPLVHLEVSTPSSMTQLVAEEQEALKGLVQACCPKMTASSAADSSTAAGVSGWCSSVGRAVTYDLRQWFADICHVAPNVCDREGHLRRLVLPPYALQCPQFPQALARFSRLQHLDMSYSLAPGSIADVAAVARQLPQLEQLHLRGLGLKGAFSCELVESTKQLKSLSLSDNDNLSGSLPPCWLASATLQELQLAGLSSLSGPLPELPQQRQAAAAGTGSGSRRGLRKEGGSDGLPGVCGFSKLKYINLAGIIGDQEQGFTGTLPASLGFCEDLLYLDLSGHALSGSLPALPEKLQFLNLSSNALSQTLPEFAGVAQLQYLDLSFNRFTGALQDMTQLPSLDWLDLSDNALSGPLPPLPPSVRWVDLGNNRLSGQLELTVAPPEGREVEMQLVLLDLKNNKLTGPLPASLASPPALSFLDLSFNLLSGSLDGFARALSPKNAILQINLSHNELEGPVPPQLQMLAAVRPVMVTMKDGLTPVSRILDLSHNKLAGTLPPWLVTNLPLLSDSCKCSVGVSLDAQRFQCPANLPHLNRRAQEVLHRFEALQCMSEAGSKKRQQIPVWQLAGSGMHQHHASMHAAGATAPAAGAMPFKSRRGVTAAIVLITLGLATVAAAGVLALVLRNRSKQHSGKVAGALLHHCYDPYHHQHSLGKPLGAAPSFERLCSYSEPCSGSASPTSSSSSHSPSRSSSGDGNCEIALVVKSLGGASSSQQGPAKEESGEGSSGKALSKDGVV